MQGDATGRVFQFGVFEANQATGELRKHGVRIKLHSQPFKVLMLLLENAGEIVTRTEMQQRLWGNDTFVDFEHGLNAAVNKIREALDDSAAQPRYVETVSGKGYRFVAALTPTETASEVAASVPEWKLETTLLTAPQELPKASRSLVKALLLAMQFAYLAFYFSALANLQEVHEIFIDFAWAQPIVLLAVLVVTASLLIPVRLYLAAAIAFDFALLPDKFRRLFPFLLPMDLLWAASPFLLVNHISIGLALAMTAALVYLPFTQRSLVLMYGRR